MSDLIERAKEYQTFLEYDSPEASELVWKLIAEVERLESIVDTYDILDMDSLLRQVDKLTKERDEAIGTYGPVSGFWGRTCSRQQTEINTLKAQLDLIEKEYGL